MKTVTMTRYRSELTPRALAVLESRMTSAEHAQARHAAARVGLTTAAYLAARVTYQDRLDLGVELVTVGFVDLDVEIAIGGAP